MDSGACEGVSKGCDHSQAMTGVELLSNHRLHPVWSDEPPTSTQGSPTDPVSSRRTPIPISILLILPVFESGGALNRLIMR